MRIIDNAVYKQVDLDTLDKGELISIINMLIDTDEDECDCEECELEELDMNNMAKEFAEFMGSKGVEKVKQPV